jgi:hypothetical protein
VAQVDELLGAVRLELDAATMTRLDDAGRTEFPGVER